MSAYKAQQREIDTLRKELINVRTEVKKTKGKIQKFRKKAKEYNTWFQESKKSADETRSQIVSLRSKHETEKVRFEDEIRNIQAKLKEKDETETEKQEKEAGGKKDNDFRTSEFSNPITILKRRLAKITATNIQKRKLIEQYMRNVRVIQDAFEQIREQTGIQSIEEIVTTFVKAEEQNYSLYNYVNRLNQDVDQLDETNKELTSEIDEYKRSLRMSEEDKQDEIRRLQQEITVMNEKIRSSVEQKDALQGSLDAIFSACKETVILFKKCKFLLQVAHKMDYE